MNRIRNNEWQNDEELQSSIKHYVMQNMKRSEVLDFLKRDYPEYAWSLPTLDRRMRHFDIKYINCETTVDEVVAAFNTENDGPGQLLGYRAMHKKLREQHGLAVPPGLVYDVMTMECPEGLERRKNVGKKKRKRGPVGTFTSLGPNHTHSADGHDKLMDFIRDTFPLAVYGLQDVFSGRLLFVKIWRSNSDPKLTGRWYLEHLYETKVISSRLRLDKGTETGKMATIHAFLRKDHGDCNDPADTVHYGPSTTNKIERWWSELHSRLEKYFKRHLRMLLEQGYYHPDNETDRNLLAFVFIPVIQLEIDIFRKTVWNSHRIREQRDAQLPKGIPDHVYAFPEQYGAEECGWELTENALDEVAELSGVMTVGEDYLPPDVREKCERIIPNIHNVKPREAADAYLFLKAHYQASSN